MVSVKSGYDPEEHFALGRALAPLREDGVLLIGSDLTYHNMRGMNQDSSTAGARAFTQYLDDAITLPDMRAREQRLLQWEHAPFARLAHPREDHLVPLFTVAGAAGDDKGLVLFSEDVLKVPMTSYVFGEIKAD